MTAPRLSSRAAALVIISMLAVPVKAGEMLDSTLRELARATWRSIDLEVEPSSGLPHDTLNRVWLDVFPQFAPLRRQPIVAAATAATLDVSPCSDPQCRNGGSYGLQVVYAMPVGAWGSYNIEPADPFDVGEARYLELATSGAAGGERFEVVLWSDCAGPFPGRPDSGVVTATHDWRRVRIDLSDYAGHARLDSLCRVSFGFNDALHAGGTLYVDDAAFVRADGQRIHIAHDEETSTTNIGLYLAAVVAARDLGIITADEALARLTRSVGSIEKLQTWHGFPQTHNHPVSLQPFAGDRCLSTVDNGYLAAGLLVVRHAVPELAARAGRLADAMEWEWTYDPAFSLPYGCRYPDGSATPTWHYDFYAADSRFAHAVGIASGRMPADSWLRLIRTRQQPRCASAAPYDPGWNGGGMFMTMLPWIFLDERSTPLAAGARALIDDQICTANTMPAQAWGWSATVPPEGNGYCGYGCDRTDFVVPHASLLAGELVDDALLSANLAALEALGARPLVNDGVTTSDFGFVSSVSLGTPRRVSPVYLLLDQSMAFLAMANRLTHGGVRQYVCADALAAGLRERLPEYAQSCRQAKRRAVRQFFGRAACHFAN